jgi:CMP-N-acetylneuraminic acid synthetase
MMCAIPARGGSKRLARKNLRELRGKPLIAYSIEAARESGFAEVYVCTEDQEIADVAVRYGAIVPRLMPADLCGDLVASHVPCQFLAAELGKAGSSFESLLCLQPSSPLRSAEDIRGAVNLFNQGNYDFVVSVTPVDPHYFHWAVVPSGETYWKMYFGSQFLKESGNFFGERLGVFETPEERSVHVATEFDLGVCEAVLKQEAASLSSAART